MNSINKEKQRERFKKRLEDKQQSVSKKKRLIVFGFIGFIAINLVIALISNPTKEDHINAALPSNMHKHSMMITKSMKEYSTPFYDNMMKTVYQRMWTYHNYFVYSYCTSNVNGRVVSKGYFGMITIYPR